MIKSILKTAGVVVSLWLLFELYAVSALQCGRGQWRHPDFCSKGFPTVSNGVKKSLDVLQVFFF